VQQPPIDQSQLDARISGHEAELLRLWQAEQGGTAKERDLEIAAACLPFPRERALRAADLLPVRAGRSFEPVDPAADRQEQRVTIDEVDLRPGVALPDRAPQVARAAAQVHVIDDCLAAAYGVAPGAVSHVSWMVPDLAQESARLARLGCRPINTARSGQISVAWHDGGPLFPHPIEVHQRNDAIAGMHGRLAALRGRNGSPQHS
jgi:hypothetical protein